MWGRREFLESSSSSEELVTANSLYQESLSTDISKPEQAVFTAKPPPTRPITANSRIMSIQRAKLLDRSRGSVRIQVSPFYRTHTNDINLSPEPGPIKKTQNPQKVQSEEIEEIKVSETAVIKRENKAKDFLPEEKVHVIIKDFHPERRKPKETEETAPQPRHQRMKLQSSTSLRARPQSQITVRSNSKEFKTITTVSVKKPVPPPLSKHDPEQKTNLFNPVPMGSKLFCLLKRNNQGFAKEFPSFSLSLSSNGIQLIAACRKRGKYGGKYLISCSDKDFSQRSPACLGKIITESSHRGMKFVRYNRESSENSQCTDLQKECGGIYYV